MGNIDISISIQDTLTKGVPFTASVADIISYLGIDETSIYPLFKGIDFTKGAVSNALRVAANPSCQPLNVSLAAVNSLLPGISIGSLYGNLPASVAEGLSSLLYDTFDIQYIDFQFLPASDSFLGIAITFAISDVSYQVSDNILLSLTNVQFSMGSPKDQYPQLDATIFGTVKLGTTDNDTNAVFSFEIDLASASLDIIYGPPVPGANFTIGDIVSAFGVTTTVFNGLDLADFQFYFSLVDKSIYLAMNLTGDPDNPFFGNTTNITLGDISLEAGTDSQGSNIKFVTQLLYAYKTGDQLEGTDTMIFSAGISYTSTSKDQLGTYTDSTVTWELNASWQASETDPKAGIALSEIVKRLTGDEVPDLLDFLKDIQIDSLSLGATIPTGAPATYTFGAIIGINWDFGGSDGYLDDTSAILINNDQSGSINSVIDIDGFPINLSYTFGHDQTDLQLSGQFGIATFNESLTIKDGKIHEAPLTITLDFPDNISIGQAIGEVTGFVTGNKNVVLTSPWDVLNDVALPKLVLEIDFSKKQYALSFDFSANPISILGIIEIDSVGLQYNAKTTGSDRFQVIVSSKQLADFGYNNGQAQLIPAQPSSTQTLPASSPPLLEIKMVVAGQNAVIPGKFTDVASGLRAASQLIQSNSLSAKPTLPQFTDSGWMLGAEMVIKGQIWFQFLFNDPQLYGAQIDVRKSGQSGSASLDELTGLSAEIDYRQVNATVGVYQGSLTLPSSAAQLDYGFCQIHLPSIAAAIYTDGGFLVNVGYPQGGDFSNSVMIMAATYIGAGGVYVSHLTQADAPSMPGGMIHANGQFGTVTAFGLGLKFGYGRSVSFGPLSGSVSLTLEGVFNGVFSEYTLFKPDFHAPTTEYYRVEATVALTGNLTASIDFLIVSAYVYVGIGVSVDVVAEALATVVAEADAYVDVTVTGKIGVGIFSVSKQFNFSHSISCGLTLYESTVNFIPWAIPEAEGMILPSVFDRKKITWHDLERVFQKFPVLNQQIAVTIWPLPVLTRTEDGWCYVADFGLEVSTSDIPDTAFSPLMETLLLWAVNAYMLATGGATLNAADPFNSLSINQAQLQELAAAIHGGKKEKEFITAADLNLFIRNALSFSCAIPSESALTNVAAFPVLPGSEINFSTDGNTYLPFPLNQDINQDVLRDYLLLVLSSTIKAAENTFDNSVESQSIADIYANLTSSDATRQIAGVATRYLQHGVRVKNASCKFEGLYAAAGQQFNFTPSSGALYMAISLSGCEDILLSSATDGLLWSQDAIVPAFVHGPSISECSISLVPPTNWQTYFFKIAQATTVTLAKDNSDSGSLWRFPADLQQALKVNPELFSATSIAISPLEGNIAVDKLTPLASYDFSWAVQIQVNVSRTINEGCQPIYTIQNVSGPVAALCEALNASHDDSLLVEVFLPVPGTSSTYVSGAAQSIVIDGSANFIYQNNFSILEDPDLKNLEPVVKEGEPVVNAAVLFVNRLLAAQLTNRGGFYLVLSDLDGGIPDSSFTNGTIAPLNVVVSLAPQRGAEVPMPQYINALRIPQNDAITSGLQLALWSPLYHRTVVNLKAGELQFKLTYSQTGATDDTSYQNSLNYLFQLTGLGLSITLTDGKIITLHPDPVVLGPDPHNKNPLTQRFTYTLDIPSIVSGDVKHRFEDWIRQVLGLGIDPYTLIGSTLSFENSFFVDLYGNMLPMEGISGTTQEIVWTEPLIPLSAWPGITVDYTFGELGPLKWMELHFSWKAKTNLISDEKKQNYITHYQRILAQLQRAEASIITSLLPGELLNTCFDGESLAERLILVVGEILFNLENIFHLHLDIIPIRLPIKIQSTVINPSVLFTLETTLSLSLKENIPVGDADPAIFSATTTMIPNAWADGIFRFRTFATLVESLFKDFDYKLLSGHTDKEDNAAFWILRYGETGIQFTVAPQEIPEDGYQYGGYAPVPLATCLLSRNDINPAFSNGAPAPGGRTTPISVTDIDIDSTMYEFLGILEDFLRPASAVPLCWINPASLTEMEKAKYKIANILSDYTTRLGAVSGSAPDFVNNSFAQAMLKSTEAFYKIQAYAGIAITPVIAQGAAFPERLAIYGQIEAFEDRGITLSPIRADFNWKNGLAPVPVAIAISNPQQGSRESYTMNGRLRIKAIHYNLEDISIDPFAFEVDELPIYQTGTWLTFVNPPAGDSLPEIPAQTIGLPLRAIPVPPVVLDENYQPGKAGIGKLPLTSLKMYSPVGTVRYPMFAQDQLTIRIQPVAVPPTTTVSDKPEDLLDALARFITYYPSLEPYLSMALPKYKYGDQPDLVLLDYVVTLGNICADIAKLSGNLPATIRAMDLTPASFIYNVTCMPIANEPSSPWQISVAPAQGSLPTGANNLVVSLPGYTTRLVSDTGAASVYEFDAGNAILDTANGLTQTDYQFSLNYLTDITGAQGAQIFYSIQRNFAFPPAFNYFTSEACASSPVFPHIVIAEPVNISMLSTVKGQQYSTPQLRSLTDHLTALYVQVCDSMMDENAITNNNLYLQLQIGLGFFVGETNAQFQLPPVTQSLAIQNAMEFTVNLLSTTAAESATKVAQALSQVPQLANFDGTATPWSGLNFEIQADLFVNSLTQLDSILPSLNIRYLYLPCNMVTEL